MCGIAAFLPKKGFLPNRRLLLTLGIANEERGTDNCGISVGKEIMVGGGVQSKFREFYIANKEKVDNLLTTNSLPMIIHTRRSTTYNTGSSYAHPFIFEFESKQEDRENYLVGCHNGVISNKEELYSKFCNGIQKDLLTIDSQYFLCSLLNHASKEDVFKAYRGDAASIFYTDKYFYAWKGGSDNVEERPLYYMETDNGWYFSSTSEALEFGSDYKAEPTRIRNNHLLIFSLTGKLLEEKVITREEPIVKGGYFKAISPPPDPSIGVNQDMLLRYVDEKGVPLEGEYFIYNPEYFYFFFEKGFYKRKPIQMVGGIATMGTRAQLIMLLNQVRNKHFNISSFMKKYRDILKKIILVEFPIIIKDKLKFVIRLNNDGTLECVDAEIDRKIQAKRSLVGAYGDAWTNRGGYNDY